MRTSISSQTSRKACRRAATSAARCRAERTRLHGLPTVCAEICIRFWQTMSPPAADPAQKETRPGTESRPNARDRILAAAVRRIASEGIDDARIARIAMDAGVSTSLVHYHFETREALLAEALEYSYTRAGDVRISNGESPVASHAQRLDSMIDQCLPTTPALQQD